MTARHEAAESDGTVAENLIELVTREMAGDFDNMDKQSQLLIDVYAEASKEAKAELDKAFVCLCGWELQTLIARSARGLTSVKVGDRVYWHDPGEDLASGLGTVAALQYEPVDADTVISLKLDDGGEAEVLLQELAPASAKEAR